MEGLIPMVYRAIKKNTTRTHYQSLSTTSYNIADFYPNDERYAFARNGAYANGHGHGHHDDDVVGGGRFSANVDKVRHRRYKSFNLDNRVDGGRLGFGLSPPSEYPNAAASQQPRKLVRFRSHRFFSCVTGAP